MADPVAEAGTTVENRWSCEDRFGRCRNPYGCHCREITSAAATIARLESELAAERERNARLVAETIELCAKWHEERYAALADKPVWQMLSSHLEYAAAIRALAQESKP